MILNFANAETEKIWTGLRSRRLPPDIRDKGLMKLRHDRVTGVHRADRREQPGNRLEALKGNRKGQHSIRINEQWRIAFTWMDGGAADVEIVDYH